MCNPVAICIPPQPKAPGLMLLVARPLFVIGGQANRRWPQAQCNPLRPAMLHAAGSIPRLHVIVTANLPGTTRRLPAVLPTTMTNPRSAHGPRLLTSSLGCLMPPEGTCWPLQGIQVMKSAPVKSKPTLMTLPSRLVLMAIATLITVTITLLLL